MYKCQLKILREMELAFTEYEDKCSVYSEIIKYDRMATRIKKRLHASFPENDFLSEKIFELEVF